MTRRLPVATASPVLDTVGSWSPPTPSASPPELPVGVFFAWAFDCSSSVPFLQRLSHLLLLSGPFSPPCASNFLSKSSLAFGLKPACLVKKNSHACSFFVLEVLHLHCARLPRLSGPRVRGFWVPSLPVGASSTVVFASTSRAADCGRAPRNLIAGAKASISVRCLS